ncbi:MAG: ABC transporter permease [Anaerolineaceae bacterium]|nr:ABC transporter permease [Anaerolineaceae bacterium]
MKKNELLQGESPKKRRMVTGEAIIGFMLNNKALMLLLVVSIALSIVSPYFLTTTNILNVIRQACVLAIMGIGFTLLLSSGSMDLSVGNLMAMIGVVMALLDSRLNLNPVLVVLVGLFLGISGLCLNTFLVQQFQLPGFILTLATGMLYTGVMWIISGGQSIAGINDWFRFIGQGVVWGIPFQIFLLVAITIIFTFLLRGTQFGRHALAMGGNEKAARVCGINIKRNKYIIATIMGSAVTVASLVTTGRAASAQLGAGGDTAMDTIAAVVIGGTPMSGGVANVPGTLIGCLLMQVISNGLNLLDVNSNWHRVAKGVIIIIAIILDVQGTKIINRFRVKNQSTQD